MFVFPLLSCWLLNLNQTLCQLALSTSMVLIGQEKDKSQRRQTFFVKFRQWEITYRPP